MRGVVRRTGGRLGAVCVATAMLVVASCGGDDAEPASEPSGDEAGDDAGDESGQEPSTESSADEPAGGGCTADRVGGSLTMVASSVTNPLDPIMALGSSRGHLENIAFYDTLLRFDPRTGAYEPQLAESLEPNDDASVWTMTLRDGVTYGNGDPLTADDVVWNVERMAGSPRVAAGMAKQIESMEVVDELTIEFTLVAPWQGFPYYFTHGGALVANPRVIEEVGEEAFPTNPTGAGAGPYEFVRYVDGEEVVLAAKDDYWGGPVCIEQLRFVPGPDSQTVYDSFRNGDVDAFFITDQRVIAEAEADGTTGFGTVYSGNGFLLNSGRSEDVLLADVRLRQAIAHAMDVDLINDRVYNGTGLPNSSGSHPDQLIWSGVEGPAFDPEVAASLVQEVMDETGWDGSLTLTCSTSADSVELSITAAALLENVGFDVTVENLETSDHGQKVLIDGDYQMACGNAVTFDEQPIRGLGQFETGSPQNRTGFGDPAVDAVLEDLRSASGPDETRAAMAALQELWNELVPSAWVNSGEWFIGWNDRLHGQKFSIASVMMFDDAWLEGEE